MMTYYIFMNDFGLYAQIMGMPTDRLEWAARYRACDVEDACKRHPGFKVMKVVTSIIPADMPELELEAEQQRQAAHDWAQAVMDTATATADIHFAQFRNKLRTPK